VLCYLKGYVYEMYFIKVGALSNVLPLFLSAVEWLMHVNHFIISWHHTLHH